MVYVATEMWESLTLEFNRQTGSAREMDAIRSKFKQLRNVKKPTGTHICLQFS